ncbi:MAG: IclR family transcriptional regulator [Acidimicrobiaceae bacterium]|jgi:IclR family acetate operon transcriptional repressor|nr:IclR family transcriptional regulator [Acidimicrobiaceae bacterium]
MKAIPVWWEWLASIPVNRYVQLRMGSVQSVDRALDLLSEVGREPGGLVDLAGRVGLATSTAARLLATLEHGGAIRRGDDGLYEIGPLIQGMTARSESGQRLETLVHPHLVELSTELGEAMCLAIASGYDTVTVDQVDAPKPIQAENWTGTRVPLHAGGAGLVVMATWADEEIENYLSGELVACNDNTVVDPDRLRSRIRQSRMRRVMWTHGEYVEGLSSASAAIADASGRAVGALYTYGPTYRYPAPGEADLVASVLLERADEISARLGGRPAAIEAS